jgi:DNA helicase-2/ATP-dependent DNA helicase PcrA
MRNLGAAPGLNQAQSEAVLAPDGPMLVLAAAGTGKTRVITYRIARLVARGVAPERILAVTFTNKAAREMQERAMRLLGRVGGARPAIGTFHSVCARILREDGEAIGVRRSFAIADASDQDALARKALRSARVDPKRLGPGELLHRIGRWKNAGLRSAALGPDQRDAGEEKDRIAARVYPAYEKALRDCGLLDFDDLLLCTQELFESSAETLARRRGRYDHILVDEYQDTNAIQYRILRLLAAEHRNLCVVGDDDQSIYGWRGAQIENLRRLERDFPGTRIVRLEENYRSCPNILRLANQLVRRNPGRYAKELKGTRPPVGEPRYWKLDDEQAEAEAVVRDVAATRAAERLAWRDFAVLFRTNEQPRLFEAELRARAVPYRLVGGYSFFDRREIRDVLAYLRAAANPSDEASLLRIVNTPPRGLGAAAVDRLVARAVQDGKTVWETIPEVIADPNAAPKIRAGLSRFVDALERARAAGGGLVDRITRLLEDVRYRDEIARRWPGAEGKDRWDSVGELLNIAARYAERASEPTLLGFLDEVALATELDAQDDAKDRDAVWLMTLHCAKGLEFPHVYMVGMEQGLLPHERSLESSSGIEEERRLAYVGVTRARDRLTLTRAVRRKRFGKDRATEPSQFLPEMFDRGGGASGAVRPEQGSDQSEPASSSDSASKLRVRRRAARAPTAE